MRFEWLEHAAAYETHISAAIFMPFSCARTLSSISNAEVKRAACNFDLEARNFDRLVTRRMMMLE